MVDKVLLAGQHVTISTRKHAVRALLAPYAEPVESQLRTVVDREVDDPWLRKALGYQLGWRDEQLEPLPAGVAHAGGKKLRAALAVLSYRAADGANAGGALAPVLPFAAAVELLHNFSLVHDDIEDGDRTRRGRPTLWTLCGVAQAVNVGDCLFGLSFRALEGLRHPTARAELTSAIARTGVELTVGQMRDLAFEVTPAVSSQQYLEMIRGKTGSLMACATYGGALLAAGPEAAACFRTFGEHLGLAFQIRDDLLGIWGQEELTGKPTGADIRRRKKSLPVLLAHEHASAADREALRNLYDGDQPLSDDEVRFVRSALDRSGVQQRSQAMADEQRTCALAALAGAADRAGTSPTTPAHVALRLLADFAVERDH